MKKPIVLILLVLAGGLALPASAQASYPRGCHPEIILAGYRACGSPIYFRRIPVGRHFRHVPLSPCEVRWHLEQQRQLAAQRAYQRRFAHGRFLHARRVHGQPVYRGPQARRCR